MALDNLRCCLTVTFRNRPGHATIVWMPDLKLKIEKLLADAADCQILGGLSVDPAKRAEYRKRADEFRELAERIRTQISERPRTDIEFLFEQARRTRELARTLLDDAMKEDLLVLAADLEQTARRARGDN